jgi:maltooligosyltrehalose trehalohydrolase
MLDWYRSLIKLRTSNAVLLDGRFDEVEVSFDESEGWLSMKRGSMQMFFNFGSAPVSLKVPKHSRLMISTGPSVVSTHTISLPASGFAALLIR